MKILFVATLSAALGLAAGCATTDDTAYSQVAARDCKVTPITTTSPTGRLGPTTALERREAEMELGRTEYRRMQLARQGMVQNNVEDALYDCAQRPNP